MTVRTQHLPQFPTMDAVYVDDTCVGVIQHREALKALNGTTPEHWAIVEPMAESHRKFPTKQEAVDYLVTIS